MDASQTAATSLLSVVRKRDGHTLQAFNADKIRDAVRKAWLAAEGVVDEDELSRVTQLVVSSLPDAVPEVEQIQDAVEVALMRHGRYKVAKSYMLYRQMRAERRMQRKSPDPDAIANYIHFAKYARYLPELQRREVYRETVDRVKEMHLRRFAHLPEITAEIERAFALVHDKRVLPSMRSMQFAGPSIEGNHNRIYNCCFTLVDRWETFSQALFLLLSGCGVGYSVQFEHVDKLPALGYIDPKRVEHHEIGDTIIGWADALFALLRSYQTGTYLEFSYAKIRPAGSILRTSGGKAPGHLKLKQSLDAIRAVLHAAQGRKLRPIECHRIMCHAADAVLSGGIRRSAMIALFSMEDSEMMYCKTGDWYAHEPWFANANNSVALLRREAQKKQFRRVFQMTKEWGDPGFVFVDDPDYGTNPCAEIGLNPVLTIDDDVQAMLTARRAAGREAPEIENGATITGWSFCNLCEINAAKLTSLEDFLEAARAATLIGTLQASYTHFPYLGWVSEVIAEREALLGIGMTGMLDAPEISTYAAHQRQVAFACVTWNQEFAAKIGIRSAARVTCVKPSGTTSLALGCVASGHHPHHARRYIRRVTADEYETVFQAFREKNPGMCVRKPDGKWVIEFPVEAPDGATLKEDLSATLFLEMVRTTQQAWVLPGTARPDSSPGLRHNVSNTVQVRPDEWDEVAEYLWEHRDSFTGVSLLPATADKAFAFAPNEAIVTEADEHRWNQLCSAYTPIDYTTIIELGDGTMLSAEAACAGGACLVG